MTDQGEAESIRDARGEDVPVLARAIAAQPLMQRYGTGAESLEKNLRAALGRDDGLIVVEDGAGLAGMAWFLPAGTFALGGYLRLIALFPGREGAGLGSRLLGEVERRTAARSRFLFLLVSAHNQAARRFYRKHGYLEAGALPGLVRPDIDEVIMWKRLA